MRNPATEAELEKLQKRTDFVLPPALLDLLRKGVDGRNSDIAPGFLLWSVTELTRGKDHAIEIDGFFMFASDDGGATFGLNSAGEVLNFTPTGVFTTVAPDFDAFCAGLNLAG